MTTTQPTFDEARSQPQPCPCGRHVLTTGSGTPPLYCPWATPRPTGRWGVVWVQDDEG